MRCSDHLLGSIVIQFISLFQTDSTSLLVDPAKFNSSSRLVRVIPVQRYRILLPSSLPGRALNSDQFYRKWTEPQRIPFEVEPSYNLQEETLIREAMNQITVDTNGCIKFIPHDADTREDFISISPLEDSGSLRYGCWSFPGRVWNQNGRGQIMGLTRGPKGCITSKREIMKTLVHALGFRMVQNRPDRDRYIRIIYDNMSPEWRDVDPYRKYLAPQVTYKNLPFDFKSVTFHPPTKFSKSELPVYEILDENKTVGTKAKLSRWDCVGITTLYGCDPNNCQDPYDEGGLFPILFDTGTSTATSPRPTDTAPTEPDFPTDKPPVTFLPFPSRPTIRPPPFPFTFPSPSTGPSDFPIFIPTPPVPGNIATRICQPDFKIDTAVYSENGKIYLFSEDRFWVMDFRGEVSDAGIPVVSRFDGKVQPPVIAGWSNGAETILVDSTRKEIVTRNERYIRTDSSSFPNPDILTEAFSYNFSTGPVVYYITDNGTKIQAGKTGKQVAFNSFLLAQLGGRITATFTVPILGSQIIGFINPSNDFAYVTPCTLNFAADPTPCFQTLPAGGWPLKLNTIISYPAGGCRNKIRLRFPQFKGLK